MRSPFFRGKKLPPFDIDTIMAEKRDYYEVLGVQREASADEMKKAYRQQARKLHPDVNQHDADAEERFKELGEAYEVLNDPQKRATYDRFGHAGLSGSFGAGGGGTVFEGFGDLFETFFGGAGGQMGRPDPRGDDLRYDLEITLEEAASGLERTIHFGHLTTCEPCRGAGSTEGGKQTCPTCRGAGQRRQVSSNLFGMQFSTVTACEQCGASGEIITNPCRACGGQGRTRSMEDLTIKIPPGVDTGSRIRYRGKGDAGLRGAGTGDLMVMIHVRQHAVFERRGADLLCEVPLPYSIATLGGKMRVPGLEGELDLDIPAGTPPGHTFRLRGKGMPQINSAHRGDEYVVVNIAVPTDLTPRQRELLAEFAQERGEAANTRAKNVLQRMKDAVDDVIHHHHDNTTQAFSG